MFFQVEFQADILNGFTACWAGRSSFLIWKDPFCAASDPVSHDASEPVSYDAAEPVSAERASHDDSEASEPVSRNAEAAEAVPVCAAEAAEADCGGGDDGTR